MQKPSKKVASIMIVVGAIVIAFIGADKIKNKDFSKNNEVAGEIESANPEKSMSIGDYIASKIESNSEDVEYTPPKTVTEFAFTELFGNYELLKNQNIATPENVDALTTSVAIQTKEFATIPNKYNLLQLKTFPDYEKTKVKQYGNEFANITEKYFKQQYYIEEEDSMKYVQAYADIKKNYGNELSKIEVPRSISDEHLDFINNLDKIGVAVVTLAEKEDDPLLSALILDQYNLIRDQQPKILITISDYFIKNGIIFSDNEPGAMWNNF